MGGWVNGKESEEYSQWQVKPCKMNKRVPAIVYMHTRWRLVFVFLGHTDHLSPTDAQTITVTIRASLSPRSCGTCFLGGPVATHNSWGMSHG